MTTDEGRVAAGVYKGRGLEGSAEYGMSEKGEEIAIAVHVPALGRNFTVFLSFSDAAMKYSVDKLRACGWTGEDVSNLAGISTHEVDVNIKYETYNGKERLKVDIYAGSRVKLNNPLDDRQKREFAARVRPFLKAPMGAPTAAAKPAYSGPVRREGAYDPGPPVEDDAIPF